MTQVEANQMYFFHAYDLILGLKLEQIDFLIFTHVFVNSFYLLNEESHNVPILRFKRIYILIPVVSDCQFSSLTNVPSNWLHVIHRLWECIITLVAFVLLFFTVGFQMSPQISCLRGCIITLIAFVWLFSKSKKCNQCNYASFQEVNLRKHLEKHNWEKSNKCS